MNIKHIVCTLLCACTLSCSALASEKIVKVGLYYSGTAISGSTSLSFSDTYHVGTYSEEEGFIPMATIPDDEFFCIEINSEGNLVASTYSNSSKSAGANILKLADNGESIFIGYTNQKIDKVAEEDPISLLLKERENAESDNTYQTAAEVAGNVLTPSGSLPYATIGGKKYAGILEFVKDSNGKIKVINHLSLDRYIKGVLPNEVYPSWENEALKAAAVATRTYTLKSIRGKHSSLGFDLCPTTCCQVYAGLTKTAQSTDNAVEETKGQVLYYNGTLAETVYHAISGGITESAAGAWGGSPESHPYLTIVETPFEKYHDIPRGMWQQLITAHELDTLISSSSYKSTITGNISKVTYDRNGGYISKMTIHDTLGNSVTLKTSSAVRSLFGKYVYSSNFTLDKMYKGVNESTSPVSVITANGVESTDGSALTVISADGKATVKGVVPAYYIDGKGYGHGVGMSQYGAQHAALEGYTYDQILNTYYPGTTLTNLYE